MRISRPSRRLGAHALGGTHQPHAHQRAQGPHALLASLDDPADSAEVHEAWSAEIKARVDDITSGRVQTLARDEVKVQLAAERAERQQR
jgi:putative addiction module component (TIGR02574 family)